MERARESLGYVERPVVGWRDGVAVIWHAAARLQRIGRR